MVVGNGKHFKINGDKMYSRNFDEKHYDSRHDKFRKQYVFMCLENEKGQVVNLNDKKTE